VTHRIELGEAPDTLTDLAARGLKGVKTLVRCHPDASSGLLADADAPGARATQAGSRAR